jgi:hypothetical protein
MNPLARIFSVFRRHRPQDAPDLTVPWAWSSAKRVLHHPECPCAQNILRQNLRYSGYPADVLASCRRGCRVCGAKMPADAPRRAALPPRDADFQITGTFPTTWGDRI